MEKEKETSIFCGNLKKVIQVLVLLVPCIFVFSNLGAQSIRRADSERVSNVGPFKASLVSSSYFIGYEFLSPFSIQNVNTARDQFNYNEANNTLSFYIQRMGETNSREKKLYILIDGEVDYIKASRNILGYNETIFARDFEWVQAPDHSIFNVLPSQTPGMQLMSKAFYLDTSDWASGVGIEIKFKDRLNKDFILGIMAVNPSQVNRLTEELIQILFQPVRLIKRSLGNSVYSYYTSFANYHFEYKSVVGTSCNNLLLSTGTHSEKINLNTLVERDLGPGHSIADWNDLKSIRDIDAWIRCLGLQNGQSFMVTRNGMFRLNNGSRQFFVRYAPNGVPSNFAVHDKIGDKLFLGSWYDLNQKILVREDKDTSRRATTFNENPVNYSDLPHGFRQLLLARSQNLCYPVRDGFFFQVKSASSPTLNLYYAWYVGCPDTRGRGQIVVYDNRINAEVGERFGYEITGPPDIEFIKDTQSHYPIFRFKTLNREVEDLKLKSPF